VIAVFEGISSGLGDAFSVVLALVVWVGLVALIWGLQKV
jgi:hypothetical protein